MILYILSGGAILFAAAVAYAIYLDSHSTTLQVCPIKPPPRIIKTKNMEEIENSETLKKKLVTALKAEELDEKFKKLRCPVCGSGIVYHITPPNGWEGRAVGFVHCPNCEMLRKTLEWDDSRSYNWNHDGSSELHMMAELYNSVKNYMK